jgi:hypothetical protein
MTKPNALKPGTVSRVSQSWGGRRVPPIYEQGSEPARVGLEPWSFHRREWTRRTVAHPTARPISTRVRHPAIRASCNHRRKRIAGSSATRHGRDPEESSSSWGIPFFSTLTAWLILNGLVTFKTFGDVGFPLTGLPRRVPSLPPTYSSPGTGGRAGRWLGGLGGREDGRAPHGVPWYSEGCRMG